jgi:hypothetical protein
MEKRCSKCGGTGPFTRDRSKPDGLYSSCKKCRKVYSNLPDNRERNRSQAKDWREANPEMARAGADAWRKSNLVKVKARRTQLGIPIYIRPMPEPLGVHLVRPWHELAGTMLDKDVAKIFDISKSAVSWYRKRMGILAFKYRDAA